MSRPELLRLAADLFDGGRDEIAIAIVQDVATKLPHPATRTHKGPNINAPACMAILARLADGEATAGEIAASTGRPHNTIAACLQSLMKVGKVVRPERGRFALSTETSS